ncbi:putative nicotinate-nucleotide adenylyltransferase [Frankliniella fusca]|uniref:Nicotinate-nucleotide adenylyltransferase n=1 Tax=Frankliniella fusca TaxID=407009 RepID=A0AAE1HVL4_9NEOP|nr:putative nicotinate-nucleotide adenylyltransferase [Frankliniella fusca]
MAASNPEDDSALVFSQDLDELITLADLAGIKAPGNTMKILIELITLGVPSREVHTLVREVLACKSRSKRTNARHSKQLLPTPEAVQENTAPQS